MKNLIVSSHYANTILPPSDDSLIISVTGHRPHRLPCGYDITHEFWNDVVESTYDYLYFRRDCVNYVRTGMALGFDQAVARICIDLRIPFRAYVPFPTYYAKWPLPSRTAYHDILRSASKVIYAHKRYTPKAYKHRNHMLVCGSDRLLHLFDGQPDGGTFHAINCAIEYSVPMVDMWPSA
jgi:hypothetical protein